MKLGFIGLGRMGQEMILHLLEQGVDVAGYNRSSIKTDELKLKIKSEKLKIQLQDAEFGKFGAVYSIKEMVGELKSPRTVWLMVAHGKPVDMVIDELLEAGLEKGDIVIDGGNSFYKDSVRRYEYLKEKGINFLDVGTSGGLEGARNGACLMIGGDKIVYTRVRPYFRIMIGSMGEETYFGPSGAGHFVKMVHNGVEYGMLQAIGEGMEIIHASEYDIDLHKVADNWSKGSVVRGWLIDLLKRALRTDPKLSRIEGVVGGGSTGTWTTQTAKELKVEAPVIEDSLKARERSKTKPTFSGKVVSVIRREFGGHAVKEKE